MEEKEKEINSKCPNCGSQLKYDGKSDKLKCISCSSLFDIESLGKGNLDNEEFDYHEMLNKLKETNVTKKVVSSLNCKNCGASLMHEDNTTSTICPFCGSSHIIESNVEEDVIPISGVVPFKLNKDDCNKKFHEWIKRKFFAPTRFKKSQFTLDLHPLYLPFWTFDMECFTRYSARRGDHRYVTVRKRNHNGEWVTERERVTDWSFRSGTCKDSFDDLMVLGSSQKNSYFINKVCNYNFNRMEKFKPEFLIGYQSEKISLSLEQGFEIAKEKAKDEIESSIRHDVGGDECRIISYTTRYDDVTFKQVLVPMYNGIYKYNGKQYVFVMNGQTAQFAGMSPVSAIKVTAFVLSIIAFITMIVLLFVL